MIRRNVAYFGAHVLFIILAVAYVYAAGQLVS
jgi:hypothetical protein